MAEVNPNPTTQPKESTNVTLVNDNETRTPGLANSSLTVIKEEEDKIFQCDKCGKPIPNDKKARMLHMSREHDENGLKNTPGPTKPKRNPNPPFNCETCDYTCRSKPTLKRHMTLIHSSKKQIKSKKPKSDHSLAGHVQLVNQHLHQNTN